MSISPSSLRRSASDDCVSPSSRRPSTRDLLRSASQTVAGGVAVLPRAGENEIGSRPSARETDAAARMDALAREVVQSLPRRIYMYAAVFCCVVMFILVGMVFFWVKATSAAIFDLFTHKPCDQPGLKSYMFITLAWGFLSKRITPAVRDYLFPPDHINIARKIIVTILLSDVPAWSIIAWGLYMVSASDTCWKTDPDIFYPTKNYLYFQVCFASVSVAACIALTLGLRRFILILGGLQKGKGCREAVSKMPKVLHDDPELIDVEDGIITSCPICMETFALKKIIVRTPCNHHFHEVCLSKWCTNHLDCPLCRQPVDLPCP